MHGCGLPTILQHGDDVIVRLDGGDGPVVTDLACFQQVKTGAPL